MLMNLTFRNYVRNASISVLSMVFLSFYTTFDGFFVSRAAGSDALAAINIVVPLTCLLFGLAVMLATGAGAIIGKRLGEGRKREADELFSFITTVLFVFSAVLTLVILCFPARTARLLGSSERLDPHVIPYLISMAAGFVPMAFKLYFEYLARTDNHPKVALFMSFSGLVLNIIMDYIFVMVLDMGTFGAGLGSTLSMTFSAAVGFMHFLRGRNLRFVRFRSEWKSLGHSMTNGSSEMMSELSTGIATLLFNLISMRLYQEEGVAAVTVVMYVYYFFIAFYMGLAVSAAPVISYDYGAGDEKAIRRMLSLSVKTILASSAVIFLFALLSSSLISSIFGTGELCIRALVLTSPVYLFCGINVFFSSYFTALSDGLSSAVISTLRSLIFVAAFIFILPLAIGGDGLWLTLAAADAATIPVTLFLYFRKGRVRKNSRGELVRAAD